MLTLRGPGHARSCALRSRPFDARGRSHETRDLADARIPESRCSLSLAVDVVGTYYDAARGLGGHVPPTLVTRARRYCPLGIGAHFMVKIQRASFPSIAHSPLLHHVCGMLMAEQPRDDRR